MGRARVEIELGHWDAALADLEQAASWANADTRTEILIFWSYLRCLPARRDHVGRWIELVSRTLRRFFGGPWPEGQGGCAAAGRVQFVEAEATLTQCVLRYTACPRAKH